MNKKKIHLGIPEFEKIIEIENALIEEEGVIGFSSKSAPRFDIPIEASKRKGVNLFITPRILPHILSSAKNMRKSFKDLQHNPAKPKVEISSKDLADLKKIAEKAGIEGKVTFYVARHTWAMVQKISLRNPTSMISDALGHKTEDVTRAYLESFKNEELDQMNRGIL